MRGKLIPVGCNRLLDRLRVAARAPADSFLLASCRNIQAVSNAELTRAEHEAHNLICTDNDESHAIEASRLNELLDRLLATA
jgi:hypothetical protein